MMKYLGGHKNLSIWHAAVETYGEIRKQHFAKFMKQGSKILITVDKISFISCKSLIFYLKCKMQEYFGSLVFY